MYLEKKNYVDNPKSRINYQNQQVSLQHHNGQGLYAKSIVILYTNSE